VQEGDFGPEAERDGGEARRDGISNRTGRVGKIDPQINLGAKQY